MPSARVTRAVQPCAPALMKPAVRAARLRIAGELAG